MRLDEVAQDTDEQTHPAEVPVCPRVFNIIHDHAPDKALALGGVDQVVPQLDCHDFRQMFVLSNRVDLPLGQLAQVYAILQRQH